jgi:sugar phosphate isomerase/epimerase
VNRREWALGVAFSGAAAARDSALVPCINQQTTIDAPFDKACGAWSTAGFRHVELWFPKLRGEGLSAEQVRSRLRDAGLTAVSACASSFTASFENMGREFEFAQGIGVPKYVVFSHVSGNVTADDYKAAAERLARIADLAAPYQVHIAFEFIANSKLAGCLPTALSLVRSAGRPNAGVCLDTFHFCAGVSKTEDLDGVKAGEIEHVHFHDAPAAIPRERLTDPDRLPPGEGSFPLAAIVRGLKRAGYRGALSVELFGAEFHKGEAGEVAARCFRATRRFV